MAFVYLRLCDNDFGTGMQRFGEDFLYNWGNEILRMSEEKIKQNAVVFMAGYSTYSNVKHNILRKSLDNYIPAAPEGNQYQVCTQKSPEQLNIR